MRGRSRAMSSRRKGAENMANCSGNSLAMLLGEISPKIRITMVTTRVATAGPWASPSREMNSSVASEVDALLTTLLPMRMVDSSRS